MPPGRDLHPHVGADIPRSTLIDCCGQAAGALRPLTDLIRDVVTASDRIHADDTPIRVLDPRKKRIEGLARGVKEGPIRVYVKDDRPWASRKAAVYWFSPDRKSEHPRTHLAELNDILQADAYPGFQPLYEPGADDVVRARGGAPGASASRLPRRLERNRKSHRPRGAGEDRQALRRRGRHQRQAARRAP